MFSLVLVVGWLYVLWHDYRETRHSAEQSVSSFAVALEEHARRSFDSGFLALERMADRFDGMDMKTWAGSREAWEFAKAIADQLPQVGGIGLVAPDGQMRMSTTHFPAPPVNVSDREFFRAHAMNGEARFLGPLIIARTSGAPVFTISIRLSGKGGEFRGVAVAWMDIDYFRKFYRSLDLGPNSSIALIRSDGKVLVREPMIDATSSIDLSKDDLFTAYIPNSPSGIFTKPSPFDGELRLAAYRQARDFPVVVVATRSMAALYEHVWSNALRSGTAVCLVLVFVWGGVNIQFRAIERELRARREVAASRDFADAILDSVRSHIAILDEHGRILRTNRPWREFAAANGLEGDSVGTNYLDICRQPGQLDSNLAEEAASGIASVIMGVRESFSMEYPCHSPAEKRWFAMYVTRLRGTEGSVVVVHENITALKLVEEELRHLATSDVLTGLENRRMLVDTGEAEFTRAKRYSQDLSLILLDCDHFKSINDRYGHAVGDKVLVALAEAMRSNVREIDHAARMGGEEFVILLPHTPKDGAIQLAERLRKTIMGLTVPVQGNEIRFTVSMGVASLSPETESFSEMLKVADDGLYRAKSLGRNRVEAL